MSNFCIILYFHVMEMAFSLKLHKPFLASNFSSADSSLLSVFPKSNTYKSCSAVNFDKRECGSWFDLLSRPLKLPPCQRIRLLCFFLCICVFTEVAFWIFFKNFSFAFINWLFDPRGLAFSLSWLSTCFPR